MTARREVWITGVGLLTCLGEGLESVWSHLERGDPPPYDDKSFAPYVVHPLAPMSFDKQIPKKSDQRQMETWQRVGVYTAGLALSDAGIAGKPDLLDHTDMIVDAGEIQRRSLGDRNVGAVHLRRRCAHRLQRRVVVQRLERRHLGAAGATESPRLLENAEALASGGVAAFGDVVVAS